MELEFKPDRLSSDLTLSQGNILSSESGDYHLVVQEDGNLVLYVSKHFVASNAIWSSNTGGIKGHQGPFHLDCQEDGNVVLYDKK